MALTKGSKKSRIRILTAVPVCDGHDSPIITINIELARKGVEVIYLGYNCPASVIARAALQEDVHAIGISSYNGGHITFFEEVYDQLKKQGAQGIPLFGGGGGTITPQDEKLMRRKGVDRIFFAGTSLDAIVDYVVSTYRLHAPVPARAHSDWKLGRRISELADGKVLPKKKPVNSSTQVLGIAGPGGAGKSTLIDELVLRFLQHRRSGRIAVVANDPSHPDSGGAILGDRATMIYAQEPRVYMRSLATRGSLSGVAESAEAVVRALRESGEFEMILVESVGIGQESDPFGLFSKKKFVDAVALVLSPFYGGRLQLQKLGLLAGADYVVVNKCDHPAARTALAEIQQRLESNQKAQPLFGTVAARHNDPGVDRLFEAALAQKLS